MGIGETRVEEIMTRDVVSVSPFTTLGELLFLFRTTNFRVFPVVDEKENLIGIVTIKDIFKAIESMAKLVGKPFLEYSYYEEDVPVNIFEVNIPPELSVLVDVEDIMDFSVVSIEKDRTVEDAFELLRKHGLMLLPVVDGDKLVGVISLFDILYYILSKKGLVPGEKSVK